MSSVRTQLMASVHKDPRGRSPFWYAAFTLPNAQRTLRSTKQKSRRLALETALAWERAAMLGRSGQLTAAQSIKVLNDVLEKCGQERMNLQSVAEFFAHW